MAFTINWDQVSALAQDKHVPRIRDNFFLKKNAMFNRLKNSGRQRSFTGRSVVVPLGFAPEGGGGGWYAGTDKFDTRIRNPITAAQYFAKNAHVTIAIDSDEELAVSGPEKVLDLVNAKMKIAEATIKSLLGGDIYNAGTNPKALTGLQYSLIDTIVTASQSYGGITCGGVAAASDPFGWWQHLTDTTAYTTGSGGTFMFAADNPVGNMISNIALRSDQEPTIILSNWGSWNDFHNRCTSKEQYERMPALKNDALAKSGFTNLMYRQIPWVADSKAPRSSGGVEKVYLIDENSMYLYVHPQRDFHFEPWRKPIDQDARVAYIFWRGEVCFDQRRSSGVITAVTAAL